MNVKNSEMESIKKKLLERKAELEMAIRRLSQEKVTDDQVQDPGDQAVSSTMESLQVSLQDAEVGEYNRIVDALAKLETGTYGVCIDCGNPISEKRLKSYPNASRCVACQELFEERGPEEEISL